MAKWYLSGEIFPQQAGAKLARMTRANAIEVRLARSPAEVEAAQRLRYEVFVREWGAQAEPVGPARDREADEYDALMDHMVVVDRARGDLVVGNYRLLRQERLQRDAVFYSSHEFDLSPLLAGGQRLLELGRSCVLREYRGGAVIQKLWHALAAYIAEHRIELMFGCASLHGTDPFAVREQLAYLHHWHLAPPEQRPRALADQRAAVELLPREAVDPARAMRALEPMVRGYLRAGAWVGEGAWVDRDFNAIDVCIVMPTARMRSRHRGHFERVIQRPLLSPGAAPAEADEQHALAARRA
jgi:putative hemolysin